MTEFKWLGRKIGNNRLTPEKMYRSKSDQFLKSKELKIFLKSKNPNIINISSIYILAPNFDLYQQSGNYNPAIVSKSGLIYLTKWLASEMSPKIRVNLFIRWYVKDTKKYSKYVNYTLLTGWYWKRYNWCNYILSTKMSEYITGQNLLMEAKA